MVFAVSVIDEPGEYVADVAFLFLSQPKNVYPLLDGFVDEIVYFSAPLCDAGAPLPPFAL